jgi:uncharacterized protein YicC (UPF0701 family)
MNWTPDSILRADHAILEEAMDARRPALHLVFKERSSEGTVMQDMLPHLEKLREQVAECEMIRDLATDKAKRELFAKLAEHYNVLAAEVRRAINERRART